MESADASSGYRVLYGPAVEGGYRFRGDVYESLRDRSSECILAGPADTGKTVARCVRLHLLCLRVPDSQHAIVRKTFASTAGSVVQTFARVIKGAEIGRAHV